QLPESIPNPVGADTVRLTLLPIGYDETDGVLVSASKRSDFPSEEDHLLLSVAASHLAIVLQRYWIEEAGRQANERRDLAIRGSNIGIWEMEIDSGDFRSSRVD